MRIPSLDFLKTGETWKYFLSNLAFLNFVQPSLPGVFTSNEIQAMNGSLWTIKIEVMLYFLVPMIVFFYKKIGANFTLFIAFSTGLIWYTVFSYFIDHRLSDVLARQFIGQLPYFALGSFLTFFDLKRKGFIYLGMISLLYFFTKKFIPGYISEYLNMLFYPLLVLTLANTNYLNLGIGKFGDLSFGIYLFHFPTIQLLVHLGLYDLNPYIGLFVSVGLTLSLAAFSWNYVEKKFLKRSSHYIEAAKQ
ncbi:acyltransferase [Marinobacterium sp. xm-a-152]|uniref:acyltransferase family protein n=1 Tax=Marinobacterium sp. xm-a-152 TaxID=2497733 RepID=UPI001567CF0D|nr:acyltransferase [Marinobacterium sp. xm-a-152]NRP15385.1 Acyltransferase family protein [Marinobacterium sp. xm-a-152]